MMTTKRWLALILAALPLAACGSASTASSASSAEGGGGRTDRLRIVSSFANSTFPNPSTDYIEPLYADSELLLRPTATGPVPWLASSYRQVNPRAWTVTLRPGLRFQNGRSLDSAALVRYFSYQIAHNPLAKTTIGDPSGFTALDDRTVEIDLPRPYPSMPYALASYSLDIYDSDTVASVHGKYEELAGKGVFTGPYAYTGSSNGTITYTADPSYYLGKPAYAGITLRTIESDTDGALALADGQADIQFYPSVQEKRTIASHPGLLYKTSSTAVTYSAFCLNPAKAPFTDVRVRQAFALAIDNDAISDTVMDGVRPALKGVFQDGFPLNVPWKTYDKARAQALLDAAGWTRHGSGPRTKDGKTLSTVITTYDEDQQAIATAAVDMLRAVGFDATVRPEPQWSPIPPLVTGPGPVNVTMQNLQNIGYEGNYYLAVSKNYDPGDQYDLSVRDSQVWALFSQLLSSSDKTTVDADFRKALTLDGRRAYYVPVVANPTAAVVTRAFAHWQIDPFYPLSYDTAGEGS